MLCEWWWGFYRSPAANSFHLPDSRRLGPSSLFFFPHGPRLDFPVRDIWENSLLLIQFSNHFHVRALLTLTWLSENSTLHICYFLSSRRKTVRVRCQGGYMVIHLSGVHPLENPCGSSLVCIFIWTATVVFQHDSSPPLHFKRNTIRKNLSADNAAVYSDDTNQHVLFVVSDERPRLRSGLPRTSVTTREWQRVSYSSGLWAKLLLCGYKTAEQLLLNGQLSHIVCGSIWSNCLCKKKRVMCVCMFVC